MPVFTVTAIMIYCSPFFAAVLLLTSCITWADSCLQKTTPISTIQGHGSSSPLVGQEVQVKGIVTGDFRSLKRQTGWIEGYFIQSLMPDNDENTSEGLFVSTLNSRPVFQMGDVVTLIGQVSEQHDLTHLTEVKKTNICDTNKTLPAPVLIKLPLGDFSLESIENMRVRLAQPYVITDVYNFIKYGEMTVSSELLMSPTALFKASEKSKIKQQRVYNTNNKLTIDDGRLNAYAQPFAQHPYANTPSDIQAIQLGQTVQTTGILNYAFGKYKIQPTENLIFGQPITSELASPQPVEGHLKVAAFNIENFFTTIDQGEENCGPLKNFSCRGADSQREYNRQLAKLVQTINTADVSIMGLQELENNNKKSIGSLVDALNTDATENKWSYIDTGLLGEDVIKVGIIYRSDHLKPQGHFALLNKAADAEFLEDKNRIIIAQTFADEKGNLFNFATVHFKSKSCRDAEIADLDKSDGQGCYNSTRAEVAQQLSNWLKKDPTQQNAKATFIAGDFNSYQYEDPMNVLASHGFTNLAASYLGPNNWTTSYRGTVGSLDYVLVNEAAKSLVQGMTQWHINSVPINEIDYNTEGFGENGQFLRPKSLYERTPFASSDHDMVIVGFSF